MKLLQINNMAPHYRTLIYQLIDRELGADFVFGDQIGDIKPMDYSLLVHHVAFVHNVYTKHLCFQLGVLKYLFRDYDTYLLTGEFRNLTTWLLLLGIKLSSKKRAFLWTHGWLGKETKTKRAITKFFFSLADGIFAYNERSRQLMIDGGIPSKKVVTIYNSLDYDKQLSIRKELHPSAFYYKLFGNVDKTLVFVGRLTRGKRLDMILNALKICQQRCENYNLVLIGDGENRNELEAMVEVLGLNERVWFYGPCYDEDLLGSLIYQADLCVSPGNVGLTAIHAMAYGTPVLTHDDFCHQMPEFEAIHDGETGCFFRQGNVDALANSISQWFMTNKDRREEVRQACYRVIDSCWNPHYQIDILKHTLLETETKVMS